MSSRSCRCAEQANIRRRIDATLLTSHEAKNKFCSSSLIDFGCRLVTLVHVLTCCSILGIRTARLQLASCMYFNDDLGLVSIARYCVSIWDQMAMRETTHPAPLCDKSPSSFFVTPYSDYPTYISRMLSTPRLPLNIWQLYILSAGVVQKCSRKEPSCLHIPLTHNVIHIATIDNEGKLKGL